jgi:hypothetical protein
MHFTWLIYLREAEFHLLHLETVSVTPQAVRTSVQIKHSQRHTTSNKDICTDRL